MQISFDERDVERRLTQAIYDGDHLEIAGLLREYRATVLHDAWLRIHKERHAGRTSPPNTFYAGVLNSEFQIELMDENAAIRFGDR